MRALDDDSANLMLDAGDPMERCYSCLKCGDVFALESDLLAHELSCTGEFVYDTQEVKGAVAMRRATDFQSTLPIGQPTSPSAHVSFTQQRASKSGGGTLTLAKTRSATSNESNGSSKSDKRTMSGENL